MKNIIIGIAILGLYACGSKPKVEEPKTESKTSTKIILTNAQLANAKLVIGNIESKNISTKIKLSGQIDVPPQNMVSVSMPLGGYLKTTKLLPGMHVVRGEAIATLEDQQYIQLQQDYLTTKTKLIYAEKDLKRQRELNLEKANSDKVYQLAQMEFNTLQVTLNSLAEKLKLININPNNLTMQNITRSVQVYSPINGFVSKVDVNIGKYVTPADVIFELINPSDIHLNLKVFEKDLSKIFIGQHLQAYNNTNPNIKYNCEIILISKDLSQDHTADVHCHFENYDHTLSPGMYMNAELEAATNTNASLPEEAIVAYEGKNFCFVQTNANEFEIVETFVGNTENGFTEIKNEKDFINKKIVTKNAYTLLMQMKNKSDE